jgi:hypothetical protein
MRRHWPLLGVGIPLVIGLGACLLFNATRVMVWDGSKDVEMRFIVVDGEADVPVPGAKVAVYDEELKQTQETHTDESGQAKVNLQCLASGRSGLFVNSASVYFGNWQLRVTKEGYKEVGPVELADFTGRGRDYNDLPPPPVRVKLTRPAASK